MPDLRPPCWDSQCLPGQAPCSSCGLVAPLGWVGQGVVVGSLQSLSSASAGESHRDCRASWPSMPSCRLGPRVTASGAAAGRGHENQVRARWWGGGGDVLGVPCSSLCGGAVLALVGAEGPSSGKKVLNPAGVEVTITGEETGARRRLFSSRSQRALESH